MYLYKTLFSCVSINLLLKSIGPDSLSLERHERDPNLGYLVAPTGLRCSGRLPGPEGPWGQERGREPDGDHGVEAQDEVRHQGEGQEQGWLLQLH